MTDLPAVQGPRRAFRIGRYRFAWAAGTGWRRWECSNGSLGVGMAVTPLRAFLSLKRWEKELARPASDA